ncbi:MAG: hypothetical protein ACI84C_001048 [Flavobacteriales bacterium]
MLPNLAKYLLGIFYCFSATFIMAQHDEYLNYKIPHQRVAADLELLHSVLSESHPGFDLYLNHHEIDSLFSQRIPSAGLTFTETYSHLASLIDHIHDGHTNVHLNEELSDYILSTQRFFPFTLKFIDGLAYVDHNFSEHEYMDRGCQVLAINGMDINCIVEELLPFITCDGAPRGAKFEQLEGQFWWFYALRFGFKSTFRLHYCDVFEREDYQAKNLVVTAIRYSDRFDLLQEVYGFGHRAPASKMDFDIKDGIGFLTINQFHGISKINYGMFLSKCFRILEDREVESLVIDIRENGGGREGFENMLLSYLPHTLNEKYDLVEIRSVESSYYQFMKGATKNRFSDFLYRTFEFKETDDAWMRRDRFQRTLLHQDPQFLGDVYVLIGGEVFSGGSDFASMAKSYVPRCTLIGTETLGGATANSSGYFYRLILPNSGLVVEIPRVLFQLNVPVAQCNRGVVPDIEVNQTLDDFLAGRDHVMNKAIEIVGERQEIAKIR